MPEEINRIVTDQLSDVLLTPSADANENLRAEGVPPAKIHLVGNIMIDSLLRHLPLARLERVSDRIPVEAGGYAVLTLHRPSNVDNVDVFGRILKAISIIAEGLPVVFPVHPRTRRRICAEAGRPFILHRRPYSLPPDLIFLWTLPERNRNNPHARPASFRFALLSPPLFRHWRAHPIQC